MSGVAIDHDQERERVSLPGYSFGIGAPTIATATEEELRSCLEKDLAEIARIMEQEASYGRTVKPTKDGFAPPEWHEKARANRGMHNNLAVVERIERRIRAIRAELPRREKLRKLEVKSKSEETRRRLEGIVEHAPVYAGNLQVKAGEVEAAWGRVRQFMLDVQLIAGGVPYVENQYSTLRKGAQLAAEALDMPAPEFDPLPSLPSEADKNALLGLFAGKGFDRVVPNIGDAANARELVRELNKK